MAIVFGRGELIVSPKDTEASIGERIELACTSTVNAIEWHHLTPGTNIPEIIYKDGYTFNGYKGRFDAKKCTSTGGECRLVIMGVNLSDAGTYICVENSEEPVRKEAQLIVYEQYPSTQFCVGRITCSPKCNALELSCSMKYSGNIDAFMEWRNSAGELVPSTISIVNGLTTSTVHFTQDHFQSSSCTCRIKYPTTDLGSRYNWAPKSEYFMASSTAQHEWKQQLTILVTILVYAIVVLFGIIIGLMVTLHIIRRRHRRRLDSSNTCRAVVGSQEWMHQPENIAVFVGSNVTLQCSLKSVSGSVIWYLYTRDVENVPMALTHDSECLENNSWKYKCSEGNRILNFNCTGKRYAGFYECRIPGEGMTMHLTILESDPICNVTNIQVVKYNLIEMWCIVNYGGHWAPVMEWGQYVTDNTTLEEFNGNVTTHSTNHSVISTLRVLVDSRRHNSRYYCKTYFTNSSSVYGKRNLAKNVPTYYHTWISPTIRVLDCAKYLNISRQLELYTSGSHVCSDENKATTTFEELSTNKYELNWWKIATIGLTGLMVSIIIIITVAAAVAKKNNKDKQITSTEFNMEFIDNESDGNIETSQNSFSRGYETVLGSEEDELYYNLAIRNMSDATSEERDGTNSSNNQKGPYEVPEAVPRTQVHNQGDPYQELRYYENTVIRYTQNGPYEAVYLNLPYSAGNADTRD